MCPRRCELTPELIDSGVHVPKLGRNLCLHGSGLSQLRLYSHTSCQARATLTGRFTGRRYAEPGRSVGELRLMRGHIRTGMDARRPNVDQTLKLGANAIRVRADSQAGVRAGRHSRRGASWGQSDPQTRNDGCHGRGGGDPEYESPVALAPRYLVQGPFEPAVELSHALDLISKERPNLIHHVPPSAFEALCAPGTRRS